MRFCDPASRGQAEVIQQWDQFVQKGRATVMEAAEEQPAVEGSAALATGNFLGLRVHVQTVRHHDSKIANPSIHTKPVILTHIISLTLTQIHHSPSLN